MLLFDREPFAPRDLFRGGIAGVFLDLSQPYRFQDAAGTTAATADAAPLGLVYDLKNGVPQLGASLTLLATTAQKTADGTTTINVLATSGVVGKAVRVQFTVASITGSFTVSSTGTNGTSVTISSTGVYDIVVMAGATGGNIKFEGLTTSRFSVTGIVIKELPGSHAYQTTTTARPLLASSPKRAVFDKSDDNWSIYFPSTITGTLLQSSKEGIIHAEINKAAGVWPVAVTPANFPSNNICHLIVRNGVMTDAGVAAAKNWMVAQGAGRDFAGVTSMMGWFRDRSDLTKVYFNNLNVSSVTTTSSMFTSNTNLMHVDLTGCNFSALSSAPSMFINCTKLETIVVGSAFSSSPCVIYGNAFNNCKLNQASMDGILNSINAANTSNGTLGMQGANNATPSASGLASAAALRARGWTIDNSNGW